MDKIRILVDTSKFDNEIEAEIEKAENFKIVRNAVGSAVGLGALATFSYTFAKSMDESENYTDNQRKTLGILSIIGAIGSGILFTCSNSNIGDIYEERAERKSITNIKRIKIQRNKYLADCINKRLAEIKKEEENREKIEEIDTKKKRR